MSLLDEIFASMQKNTTLRFVERHHPNHIKANDESPSCLGQGEVLLQDGFRRCGSFIENKVSSSIGKVLRRRPLGDERMGASLKEKALRWPRQTHRLIES